MGGANLVSDPKWAVDNDICPVRGCCGPLDTGWTCNKCGYDAMWVEIGRLRFLLRKFKSWFRSR